MHFYEPYFFNSECRNTHHEINFKYKVESRISEYQMIVAMSGSICISLEILIKSFYQVYYCAETRKCRERELCVSEWTVSFANVLVYYIVIYL